MVDNRKVAIDCSEVEENDFLCGCETWFLILSDEAKYGVFEIKKLNII